MVSEQNLKNIPFGQFSDQLLSYANQTFSTLHHKFLKEIWGDNKTTNKLHSNQCTTNWQEGTYEVYIPTRDSVENNLQYSRIAIQILPEISESSKYTQAYKLMNHQKEPLGIVESELLVLIGYKQNKPGIVRGFKHRNKPGYFTGVFVSRMRSPELIWKRIIDHIQNFIQKRLDGFMSALGFETWVWKWTQKSLSCSTMEHILEHFSHTLRQSMFTFLKLWNHLRDCMKVVLHEIGVNNVAWSKTVYEIREEIDILQHALKTRVKLDVSQDTYLTHLVLLARR
jgi:hypothetical protein